MTTLPLSTTVTLTPLLAQETTGGGFQAIEATVMALLFLLLVGWIGNAMATATDRAWLPQLVVWGYLAKLGGTLARFFMVTVLYGGGDSYDYQAAGEMFAGVWRALEVPISDAGGQGTAFTEVATGFLYALYTPTFLGGFIMFATLSFFGQLLFLSAFRRWIGPEKQKLYAKAVLFFPSLLFWPSSIGKDALMVFFLGLAAYGASRLLATYKITSIVPIGLGLVLAAGIRPHVAGMMALALVLAIIVGKPMRQLRGSPMRPILLIVAILGAGVVLSTFSSTFEVDLESDRTTTDVGGFLDEVSEQTSTGGSEIDGAAISAPSQIPAAILTVLFRPLLHEGANAQMILSALEGTFLLGVVIWKLPQIWRNRRLLRRKAYLTMSFFYTGGFIIGFSAILNLGILARQRVQVLPMFLALLIGLGWPESDEIPPPRAPLRVPLPVGVGGPGGGFDVKTIDATMSETAPEPEPIELIEPPDDAPPVYTAETVAHEETHSPVRDRIRAEVVELRTSNPGMSIRAIARQVEASPSSVRRVLSEEGLL